MQKLDAPVTTAEELEIIVEYALQMQNYHNCGSEYAEAKTQLEELLDLGDPKREHTEIVNAMFEPQPGEESPYRCKHHQMRTDPLGLADAGWD